VPANGQEFGVSAQNRQVNLSNGALQASKQPDHEGRETTVLVAVQSARVREALVAMLGAIDGFRVVAEADTDLGAVSAARTQRPRLALVEPELSDCGGWWAIQQIQLEQTADVIVALSRRADARLAQLVGAQSYVQIGIRPRDLLNALEAAIASVTRQSRSQTEHHLLANTDAVLDKPAFIYL
jgi:DNA-binding NarL/FixJ family response regulator